MEHRFAISIQWCFRWARRVGDAIGLAGGLSVQRGDHGYRNVGGQVGVRMAW
ncbi:hypothetical protein [uncultured Stenotrophomonas sp.]|uniref:hypothetical protein n=1 Tax=uncultured Stenotrophomonas sp. TaxID=165438 RepID=UPI0025D76379|nr:hypothetical protein [uncultured Stenotrophomonas sp.]